MLLFHSSERLKVPGILTDFKVLPGEYAFEEIDHDVAKREQVISPWQLEAQVGIDRNVSASANKVLSMHKLDMLASCLVNDRPSETKVDKMHEVWVRAQAHHDIFGFQIAMDKI